MGSTMVSTEDRDARTLRLETLSAYPGENDLAPLFGEIVRQFSNGYEEWASLDAVAEDTKRKLAGIVADPAAKTMVARREYGLTGIAAWRVLRWDTEQFGFPAARLELLAAAGDYPVARETLGSLLRETLSDAQAQGIRHMVARVDAGNLAAIHALEEGRFETIDGIQTFALRLRRSSPGPGTSVETRLYRDADLPQVLAIARNAYILDRFHADTALTAEKADAVNQEWVRNSCLGKAADAVIVACAGDRVLGYVTCKLHRETSAALGLSLGSIGMVATAAVARGRGVATTGTRAALEWFRGRNVDLVEVGTQMRNIAAGRLYEKCGFRLSAASLTLRKVL